MTEFAYFNLVILNTLVKKVRLATTKLEIKLEIVSKAIRTKEHYFIKSYIAGLEGLKGLKALEQQILVFITAVIDKELTKVLKA